MLIATSHSLVGVGHGSLRHHCGLLHFVEVEVETLDVMYVATHTRAKCQYQRLPCRARVKRFLTPSFTTKLQLASRTRLEPKLVAEIAKPTSSGTDVLRVLKRDSIAKNASMGMRSIMSLIRLVATMVDELIAVDKFSVMEHLDVLYVWHIAEV